MEGIKKEEKAAENRGGDHTSTEVTEPCLSDGEGGESPQHQKDLPQSSDEAGECAVDKPNTSAGDGDTTSPREKQPVKVYALEKPPPPIKVRRESVHSHATSPPELSPPPSPKRMRELERKEGVFRSIVPPSQGLQHNL